jgi:hypothetical protein
MCAAKVTSATIGLLGLGRRPSINAIALLILLGSSIGLLLFDRLIRPLPGASPLVDTMLQIAAGLVLRQMRSLQQSRSEHELALQGTHDGFWTWNPRTKKLEVGQRLSTSWATSKTFCPTPLPGWNWSTLTTGTTTTTPWPTI